MNSKIALLVAGAAVSTVALAQEANWAKSFDDAKQTAIAHHQLVMADFYADW